MIKYLLVLSLFLVAALPFKININPKVNGIIKHETWVEEDNDMFAEVNMKSLLGWNRVPRPDGFPIYNDDSNTTLPTNFTSSEKWPQCTTISTIQNQARCGSCWAFGAVEAISDRFCTMNNISVQLSFQDLVTCDKGLQGCQGGNAWWAHLYVLNHGIVTAECSPYTVPTCPPAKQPCMNWVETPNCEKRCVKGYHKSYENDLHYIKNAYEINTPTAMQHDLINKGPFESCFTVYEDFIGYKSGVYKHSHGEYVGGHCVKIIGYGVEDSTPYWLVANSWSTSWGDQGFFKILRGTDECGIESDVIAGIPRVN